MVLNKSGRWIGKIIIWVTKHSLNK
jgi:hypothetical protein